MHNNSLLRLWVALLLMAARGGLAVADTIDRTSLIQNPSFETETTTGWIVNNMSRQNNSVFSLKKGSYYAESWVSIGQKIGDASVRQTLRNLPKGTYKLTASALHIQQSGSGSTTNKGAAQKGVCLFAGSSTTEVTAMRQYAVTFAVLEEKANVEIGLKAEGATGNYLCVDNFTLQYTGEVTAASFAQELQNLIGQGQALLDKGIQNDVAEALTAAVGTAQKALEGTGTDDAGNTLYDEAALTGALTQLQAALKDGQASRALYDTMQERIDYAGKVIGWWEDVPRKATALANLKAGLESGLQTVADYTLTRSQLTTATTQLKNRIAAVDKKIYCSTNACGTDAQLKNASSQWCYDRSLQSKQGYCSGRPATARAFPPRWQPS